MLSGMDDTDDFSDQARVTLRIPRAFRVEVDRAASAVGISFNAFVLVAVRDYLDRRQAASSSPVVAAPVRGRQVDVERASPVEAVERPRSDAKSVLATLAPRVPRKSKRKARR